jgi:hypothetical protein
MYHLTDKRRHQLQHCDNARLTLEEFKAKVHWCMDWDLMLIYPPDREFEHCHCTWDFEEKK